MGCGSEHLFRPRGSVHHLLSGSSPGRALPGVFCSRLQRRFGRSDDLWFASFCEGSRRADYFTNGEWLKLLNLGIGNRSELLNALGRSATGWLATVLDAARNQRDRAESFSSAMKAYLEGRM